MPPPAKAPLTPLFTPEEGGSAHVSHPFPTQMPQQARTRGEGQVSERGKVDIHRKPPPSFGAGWKGEVAREGQVGIRRKFPVPPE